MLRFSNLSIQFLAASDQPRSGSTRCLAAGPTLPCSSASATAGTGGAGRATASRPGPISVGTGKTEV